MITRSCLALLCSLLFVLAGCIAPTSPGGTVPPPTATGSAETPSATATTASELTPVTTGTATVSAPTGEVGTCVWSARYTAQPSGQLRVTGTCILPTPGYSLSLTRAEPQGINPSHLLLNLTATEPSGIVTQVLTPTEVTYEETTDLHYERVDINSRSELVEGESIAVEEVSQ